MSRSYGQYCGLARALDVVGDRWNLLIVRQLVIAPARYRELVEGLPGVATNLLADRLRDLETAGVIELFETQLRNQAVGRILGKGYSPADFSLLCYGGGGPLHVAGYTQGVPYQQVLVPEWAAGFSAFGCACGDYAYRYDLTIDMPIQPTATNARMNQ